MDKTKIFELLYITVILLIALPMHELAHGWVAYKLGDDTAKKMGRLTMNPLKHLDLLGTVMMYAAHFGWAKPVPVNPNNFKNKRYGMFLVALAGPGSNLILAFLSMMVMGFLVKLEMVGILSAGDGTTFTLLDAAFQLLNMLVQINILLAMFNLLPIPPLDGSRVLTVILPPKWVDQLYKAERYIGIVFLILIIGLPRITGNPGIVSVYLNAVSGPVISAMAWVAKTVFALS